MTASQTASARMSADWRATLRRPAVLVALVALVALAAVWGVLIIRAAQPPSLDQRVHSVASQLQCPICNGESVADSPSGLASEMRGVIRQKLAQGETDQQVIQYFQARYGDTILEAPPKSGFTTLIWLPPVLMLLVGSYLVFAIGREWSAPSLAMASAASVDSDETLDLTDEERQRLREALLRELERDEGMPLGGPSAREEQR